MHESGQADGVIFFVGKRFGDYQCIELASSINSADNKAILLVGIGSQKKPEDFPNFIVMHAGNRHMIWDNFTNMVPPGSVKCAMEIMGTIKNWWRSDFATETWVDWDDKKLLNGLPSVPQLFDYEKRIIEFYSVKQLREIENNGEGESVSPDTRERFCDACERWPKEKIEEWLEYGVPAQWPTVHRYPPLRDNYLKTAIAGDFRTGQEGREALVRAAALMELEPINSPPIFPEAGPRPKLSFPQRGAPRQINVAILVAGGIAPGINAVIDALVQRHYIYKRDAEGRGHRYELRIFGVKNGFLAIGESNSAISSHLVPLRPQNTIEFATRGGSMLGTSRDEDLLGLKTRYNRLENISNALSQRGRMIDILYIIGGDGSMKAAHALWHFTNRKRQINRKMAVVTIPKTMDNDILWVWQSFGFLSAVDESRKIVETLHTEVRSNPRLGIVQLFGSDSGFVVSHAVLASAAGHAMLALIPEIEFSAAGVARYLKKRLWETANPDFQEHSPTAPIDSMFPHGLVVMAENAVPQDALECLGLSDPRNEFLNNYPDLRDAYVKIAGQFELTQNDKDEIRVFIKRRQEGQRLEGQTSDTIRKLGLKIMAEAIPILLSQENLLTEEDAFGWDEPDWSKLRVVCSEPRHLVRALEPSTSDIITGQRLGLLAVDAAMAGYTDCMISQWLTEFALVPLELVVLGRKRIPPQGMFWKSVISKTEQHHDLVTPYPIKPDLT
ncbi:6-phosphofructokinase [bacterium]|nr:6-phosphofructokinase [bacterium]